MVLCCLFLVSVSVTFHLMFVKKSFLFDLGCCEASIWEKAAHSVGHMFSLHFVYL